MTTATLYMHHANEVPQEQIFIVWKAGDPLLYCLLVLLNPMVGGDKSCQGTPV